MSILNRSDVPLKQQREHERLVAQIAEQQAKLEYLAVMTDCEEILNDDEEVSE